jgi:Mrp family chromosome partitioning ATPase
VAISLAATIAEADRKILLIDGDLRNPTLTKFFGFRTGPGVLDVLYGTENLADITHHNDQYGFDFLCGPTKVRPVHTADLLNSGAMRKLLADATRSYHYVVVDLPPILPVIDVRACSHLFDSFALVVEWGRTAIDDLERAFRISPIVHDRLLGVVLNKVDTDAMLRIEGSGYPAYGHYVDARTA